MAWGPGARAPPCPLVHPPLGIWINGNNSKICVITNELQ